MYQGKLAIPVSWKGIKPDRGFRSDVIVENKVIAELNAAETLHQVSPKQVLTHLKLTNFKLGMFINFNVVLFKNGIKPIVNNL